ncbi:M50 family metallopeptidase [Gordonia phosphorivorans]|uniref:Zinc metalloprotease Rip1 n=1 Tax=Gordonia phosphorivorans TaxID=1056982 RepID=A0ABV6H8F8_9ACTN
MSFALGVALFALALLISIAWHELGHMWAAQATGMKVRRYFVGFGPTLWSTRRGETEYGLKAVPLGGFCDIAGMTPYDQLAEEDRERAMYKQATWKRVLVLLAGPAQNFVFAFALVVVLGLGWGLPVLGDAPVHATSVGCVAPSTLPDGKLVDCTGPAPAAAAGLRSGDRILAVDGQTVSGSTDLITRVQESTDSVRLTIERDGARQDLTVPVTQVQRMTRNPDKTLSPVTVGAIGVGLEQTTENHYNALTVWGGAASFTGDMFTETYKALIALPSKIDDLWTAVTGGERAVDTPVSVWGASVTGGQAVERGYWDVFLLLLISVNFFLGAFNLVPLLPLDGGHIAIALYERLRDAVRGWFGKAKAGPVDYYKLLPLTYAVVAVMGAFMVLTLTADIVNPIQIF